MAMNKDQRDTANRLYVLFCGIAYGIAGTLSFTGNIGIEKNLIGSIIFIVMNSIGTSVLLFGPTPFDSKEEKEARTAKVLKEMAEKTKARLLRKKAKIEQKFYYEDLAAAHRERESK